MTSVLISLAPLAYGAFFVWLVTRPGAREVRQPARAFRRMAKAALDWARAMQAMLPAFRQASRAVADFDRVMNANADAIREAEARAPKP